VQEKWENAISTVVSKRSHFCFWYQRYDVIINIRYIDGADLKLRI
jgi:hypothetical protein